MKKVLYIFYFKDGYYCVSSLKSLSKPLFIELVKKHGTYLGRRTQVYGNYGIKVEI